MAKKREGADEVIYVPTEELVAESIGETRLRPNAARKKKAARKFEEPTLDLYGGFDSFLVRTALIRASDYDERNAPQVSSPEEVFALCKHLQQADQEHMVVIAVNNQLKLMAIHESAVGGMSSAAVEARQLLKVGFLAGAPSVFMVHNHPGGKPTPSQDDVQMTKNAKEALKCVGMRLLDHVIVARDGYFSLHQAGLL